MDVTPGGLGVSCDTEGKLKLWLTESGEVRVSSSVVHNLFQPRATDRFLNPFGGQTSVTI